jgi:hypothetical protein
VMNYPKTIKAFYMRLNDDGRTVAAMDVLAPGSQRTIEAGIWASLNSICAQTRVLPHTRRGGSTSSVGLAVPCRWTTAGERTTIAAAISVTRHTSSAAV